MSYIGVNAAQLGVLIPQQAVTGLLQVDQVVVFDLLTSVSYTSQGQVARHPVQSGREGPTDAILEEPERCALTGVFVDKPVEIGFTFPSAAYAAPDRCLALAQGLADLKRRRSLVTAVLPGRVLPDRAIATLETTPSPDGTEVTVSLTLEHVRVVSLTLLPAVADSDTKALGQQVVEVGYGGGRVYTGPTSA